MPFHLLDCPSESAPQKWDADFLHLIEDDSFDSVFPKPVQEISTWHWTPVDVARKAASMLVTKPGTRVLDVGCGPGKFCAIGAATTDGIFTGVEQRESLVEVGRNLIERSGIERARILHANITAIDFREYEAFYIFNPFEENIRQAFQIDADVELKTQLYGIYTRYVAGQLAELPLGTRVVTYAGHCEEIPDGYECNRTAFGGQLKLWVHTYHIMRRL
ncbi:MAG: class I SAM-dependent methyltransferase [Verrucomicrobium sp.]